MPERTQSLIATVAAVLLAAACSATTARADQQPTDQDFALIEKGRYLTAVADCAACHTSSDSQDQFAGGRAIETPFGKVLAANITPDVETGIGGWTDSQFDAAVRLGRLPDGSRLYPAMPFPYYTRMTAADVRAIRAYLSTLPAVHHEVHSNQLPFPFSIRSSMWLWDSLYFEPGPYKGDPDKSAEWNRGAYLVRGPAHCAACHSPKTALGGDRSQQPLQGYALQGWFAPDITGDTAFGLGDWSVDDVVAYLKTGHNRLAAASGPMGEEVADSSSKMTDADLHAIAVFLKDVPGPAATSKPVSRQDKQMLAGAAIYQDLCSACHREDGGGVPYLIPNLAHSSSVGSREPTSLLRVVIHGARSVGTAGEPTAPAMPSFGWQLSDEQIAAVTTFVRNSWGHAAPAVSASEVHKARPLDGGGP
jgi:mono/diheme cytochrome c family protein